MTHSSVTPQSEDQRTAMNNDPNALLQGVQLKPCPFCGSQPKLSNHLVLCNDIPCKVNPTTGWHHKQHHAIDCWNSRAPDTEAAERIATLERELAEALREVEVLRQYGNKDCTAMAEAELSIVRGQLNAAHTTDVAPAMLSGDTKGKEHG